MTTAANILFTNNVIEWGDDHAGRDKRVSDGRASSMTHAIIILCPVNTYVTSLRVLRPHAYRTCIYIYANFMMLDPILWHPWYPLQVLYNLSKHVINRNKIYSILILVILRDYALKKKRIIFDRKITIFDYHGVICFIITL